MNGLQGGYICKKYILYGLAPHCPDLASVFWVQVGTSGYSTGYTANPHRCWWVQVGTPLLRISCARECLFLLPPSFFILSREIYKKGVPMCTHLMDTGRKVYPDVYPLAYPHVPKAMILADPLPAPTFRHCFSALPVPKWTGHGPVLRTRP